jgi:hypothetical protein
MPKRTRTYDDAKFVSSGDIQRTYAIHEKTSSVPGRNSPSRAFPRRPRQTWLQLVLLLLTLPPGDATTWSAHQDKALLSQRVIHWNGWRNGEGLPRVVRSAQLRAVKFHAPTRHAAFAKFWAPTEDCEAGLCAWTVEVTAC